MSIPSPINRSVVPRSQYIGGSAAATILGKNEYETRLDLWDRKVNDRSLDLDGNRHVMRGSVLEPMVEQWVKEHCDPTLNSPENWLKHDYGAKVRGDSAKADDAQIMLMDESLHPITGKPYIGGHPDGVGDEILWEFKVPTSYKLERVVNGGPPDQWIFQVQHYMMISGLQLGCIATWDCNRWEPHLTWIDADPYVQEVMREEYERFWNFVANREMPPESAETQMHIEQQIEVDSPRLEEALKAYNDAYTARYAAKDAQDTARLQVLALVKDRKTVITPNYRVQVNTSMRYGKPSTRLTVRQRDEYDD